MKRRNALARLCCGAALAAGCGAETGSPEGAAANAKADADESVAEAAAVAAAVAAPASVAEAAAVAAPAGYGRYCSLSYPGGRWSLSALPAADSQPCSQLLAQSPGGAIARAGLWSTGDANDVLVRCENGAFVALRRGAGDAPIGLASADAQGHTGCVFTVSPASLPVFGRPDRFSPPQRIDPLGWRFVGPNVGSFSINLWRTDEAPPAAGRQRTGPG